MRNIYKKNSNKEITNNDKIKNKRKSKKFILISVISALLIACLIIFFIKKIPSRFYGTYIQYIYIEGKQYKNYIEISPLSIKTGNYKGNDKTINKKLKYQKRGKDLIVKSVDNKKQYYITIDEDKLFIEDSKDISLSKKYFYWNEKSDKADLYEIDSLADDYEYILAKLVNEWSRELIYKSASAEIKEGNFYVLNSDEESDITDLNSYEVNLKAANGKLSLYFDRKNKKLESVYFIGTVSNSLYSGTSKYTMNFEDIYDCKALLLACMFLLDNQDNLELSDNLDTIEELTRQYGAVMNYDALFINKTIDEENEKKYYFLGEKYNASFHSDLYSSYYSLSGTISWTIDVNN